ncbi:leucine-rich repeat flightless-interacting protein 2-like isoform X2 [Mugil cephalus]|uniref:leucine-rich repeat flightless-interacting protein 2-like isoform X2 n=1 Tax=Mugil cephalus TaxID=48193 RepID=UPI001FB654B9|nr:leucine-rich repeat flightless-interacting protein 2-like isoform X2 [Mugil cephalus]
MGTQGPGRKRIPNWEKMTAEDDALNQIAREAEARLAAKRAARAEAREIRMKELERQQKEEDSEQYSRHSRRQMSMSDDEERMSVGSRGSFKPSDYSSFLGSGSRASSRASSARASPVVEERMDILDKVSRTPSSLSAATLASLGGASSRRGSCDTSVSVETEASIREIKDSLAEVEVRYRRAMVSNAQLHDEKTTLMYEVETLKEELSDMEEELWEARRHGDDRSKEIERLRQILSVLRLEFRDLKDTLKDLRLKSTSFHEEVWDLQGVLKWNDQKMETDVVLIECDRLRDEVVRLKDVLKRHGVTVANGDPEEGGAKDDVIADSGEAPCGQSIDLQQKKLFEERQSSLEQLKRLKSELEQRQKNETNQHQDQDQDQHQDQDQDQDQNQDQHQDQDQKQEDGMDAHLLDMQRGANKQLSELRFKLVRSEQEVSALEQNVVRLEGQVSRYRSALDKAERTEDELKAEKRKLQRELRSALDQIVELDAANRHLSKRLEKMKANRSALLSLQ